MNQLQATLRELQNNIDHLRRLAVNMQERAHLERSRTQNLEDQANQTTNQIQSLNASITILTHQTNAQMKLCENRRNDWHATLDTVHNAINAVLESHTKSIHDNNLRLDQVSEQFAHAGFSPLALSHGEHVPDHNDPNPKPLVNPTKPIVDPATTNTRTSSGPRPTVPAEQRTVN